MRGHVVRLEMPDGAVVRRGIDASGRWVPAEVAATEVGVGVGVALAGLVDAHAHLTSRDVGDMNEERREGIDLRIVRHAFDQLTAGVLMVLDKGTHLPQTVAQALAVPEEERPWLQLAGGFLASPGGYYPGIATEVEQADLAAAVDLVTPPLATWVKFIGDWPRKGVGAIPNFDEASLRAAVGEAHRRGLRTAIHAAAPETPGRAVRAGVDSIEHGLFLTEDDLAMLGARGGAWVPTIAAMESVAASMREGSSGRALFEEGLANVRRLLPHAAAAGVTVMAGTDLALAHGDLAVEAQALRRYGLPEADVIRALTAGPREFLGRPGFEAGAPADFVVLDACSVEALAAPRLVVRCGRIIVDRRQ